MQEIDGMKRFITLIVTAMITLGISQLAQAAQTTRSRDSIDPSFKLLLTLRPRKADIVNPMIPRISAETAKQFYGSGKAVFIAAGEMAIKAKLPGAISLTESLRVDPSGLRIHADKLILLFCH
jgi:hypothetical protein